MVVQEGSTMVLPQPPPKPARGSFYPGQQIPDALLRSASGVHPVAQIFVATSMLQSRTRQPASDYQLCPGLWGSDLTEWHRASTQPRPQCPRASVASTVHLGTQSNHQSLPCCLMGVAPSSPEANMTTGHQLALPNHFRYCLLISERH